MKPKKLGIVEERLLLDTAKLIMLFMLANDAGMLPTKAFEDIDLCRTGFRVYLNPRYAGQGSVRVGACGMRARRPPPGIIMPLSMHTGNLGCQTHCGRGRPGAARRREQPTVSAGSSQQLRPGAHRMAKRVRFPSSSGIVPVSVLPLRYLVPHATLSGLQRAGEARAKQCGDAGEC